MLPWFLLSSYSLQWVVSIIVVKKDGSHRLVESIVKITFRGLKELMKVRVVEMGN